MLSVDPLVNVVYCKDKLAAPMEQSVETFNAENDVQVKDSVMDFSTFLFINVFVLIDLK